MKNCRLLLRIGVPAAVLVAVVCLWRPTWNQPAPTATTPGLAGAIADRSVADPPRPLPVSPAPNGSDPAASNLPPAELTLASGPSSTSKLPLWLPKRPC